MHSFHYDKPFLIIVDDGELGNQIQHQISMCTNFYIKVLQAAQNLTKTCLSDHPDFILIHAKFGGTTAIAENLAEAIDQFHPVLLPHVEVYGTGLSEKAKQKFERFQGNRVLDCGSSTFSPRRIAERFEMDYGFRGRSQNLLLNELLPHMLSARQDIDVWNKTQNRLYAANFPQDLRTAHIVEVVLVMHKTGRDLMEACAIVGKRYRVSGEGLNRRIRNLINSQWLRTSPDILETVYPSNLLEEGGVPKVSEFIGAMIENLRIPVTI